MSIVKEKEGVIQSPLEEELDLKHVIGHNEKLLSVYVVMSQTFDLY